MRLPTYRLPSSKGFEKNNKELPEQPGTSQSTWVVTVMSRTYRVLRNYLALLKAQNNGPISQIESTGSIGSSILVFWRRKYRVLQSWCSFRSGLQRLA